MKEPFLLHQKCFIIILLLLLLQIRCTSLTYRCVKNSTQHKVKKSLIPIVPLSKFFKELSFVGYGLVVNQLDVTFHYTRYHTTSYFQTLHPSTNILLDLAKPRNHAILQLCYESFKKKVVLIFYQDI